MIFKESIVLELKNKTANLYKNVNGEKVKLKIEGKDTITLENIADIFEIKAYLFNKFIKSYDNTQMNLKLLYDESVPNNLLQDVISIIYYSQDEINYQTQKIISNCQVIHKNLLNDINLFIDENLNSKSSEIQEELEENILELTSCKEKIKALEKEVKELKKEKRELKLVNIDLEKNLKLINLKFDTNKL